MFFGLWVSSQTQQPTDSLEGKKVELNEVVVSSSRVNSTSPITFSEITKEQLQKVNLGQDIPVLLSFSPSVVSTTFDGTGVGYSDLRIRGTDNAGINVTINGIPYNDADSRGTFWVNLQDFTSSVDNIQIQRGVGTSTNGAGAFGASVNVLTDDYSVKSFGSISSAIGSFNTFKNTVKFGTGELNDHFSFSGRLSRITSDGYIDRAFSNLRSYFLSGAYRNDNTLLKVLVFGGEEVTGLSFFGIDPNADIDRRFNADGQYFDADGNEKFYDRQTDNYKQDHYQMHLSHQFNTNWYGNVSLHYTYGRGFYEQYNDDLLFFQPGFGGGSLDFYRLPAVETQAGQEPISSVDLITRRHLNSDFYGTVFNLNYTSDKMKVVFGGGFNRYDGEQFGEITYADLTRLNEVPQRFYDNVTDKKDFNIYAKATWNITDEFSMYGDAQVRNVSYSANGSLFFPGAVLDVDKNYTFFNPKAGITYKPNDRNSIYFSYARANREPARVDFENGDPKAESLNDFELGWRIKDKKFRLNTNVYYYDFQNQLILTGERDAANFPIRQNSGSSYRLGLEIDAAVVIGKKITVNPNLTLSQNRNIDFIAERNGNLTNLGNTNISFSPDVIAGNVVTYSPNENIDLSLFSKYVGKQYINNFDTESVALESYFTSDFNIQYKVNKLPVLKSMVFSGQVNNVFNNLFSNNAFYFNFDVANDENDPSAGVTTIDGSAIYPQAGINFLLGITLNF